MISAATVEAAAVVSGWLISAPMIDRRRVSSTSGVAVASRASIASQVEGLDVEAVVNAADDPLAWPAVRRGEQFARAIGSTSTPDFYVRMDGRMTQLNPQGTSPEAYAAALDAALGDS
jgi:hypothetical protein